MNIPLEKEWPQILAVLISCFITITTGILFAWPSPSIPQLIGEDSILPITLEEASYITVIPPIIAALGSFPYSSFMNKVGRKPAVLIIAIPYTLYWILIAFADSIWMIYLARVAAGLGDAGIFSCLPIYVAEVSSPKIRGSWGNAFTTLLFSGTLVMNVAGVYCDIKLSSYIFVWLPVLFVAGFVFMPETPHYYVMKGRSEEAKGALRWLRRKQDVEVEYNQIADAVKLQLSESGSLKDLFCDYTNRKAVIVGVILRFTQQFSGFSAFLVYSKYLFEVAGGNVSSSASAIICCSVLVIATTIGSITLDKLGRRKATFISGIGCNVVLILMSIFLYLNEHSTVDLSSFLWFPVVGMIVFISFFGLGLGITPNLMLGELFSASIKGHALATMNVTFGIFLASSTKIFQLILVEFGLYATFAFYAMCSCSGLLVCYYIVPETKGKTLEQIQQEFNKKRLSNQRIEPAREATSEQQSNIKQ